MKRQKLKNLNYFYQILTGSLIIMVIILLIILLYFYDKEKNVKNNQIVTSTSPLSYKYNLTINDKQICNNKSCFSEVYHYYWVNNNVTDITIKIQSDDPQFKINADYKYQIKEGENILGYAKDLKINQILNITIYKTSFPEILTTQPIDFQEISEIIDTYYSASWIIANINSTMINSNNLDFEKYGGKEIKCARKECKDTQSLKKYIMKNYKVSENHAQNIIDSMLEIKDLIIKNNALYFIYHGGTGIDASLNYKGYIEQDNKLYMFYQNVDFFYEESSELGEFTYTYYTLLKENNTWVIDGDYYLGKRLELPEL